METDEPTITISLEHYRKLVKDQDLLDSLHFNGVENWKGYAYSLDNVAVLDDDEDDPTILEDEDEEDDPEFLEWYATHCKKDNTLEDLFSKLDLLGINEPFDNNESINLLYQQDVSLEAFEHSLEDDNRLYT